MAALAGACCGFTGAYFFYGVADFLEGFDEGVGGSLVGIVLDGDGLVGHVGGDVLNAFHKAEAVLDLLFAVLAVHLRSGGHYVGLDVLGNGHDGAEHNAQQNGHESFHCC